MVENAIEVRNLTKRYNGTPAVDQLGFTVKRGTAFGFLGPNGAGKTTTIKMLVGLIRPDSGTAIVAGHDILGEPMAVRRSIGVVQENQGFYSRMTAAETLEYLGRLLDVPNNKRRKRLGELLDWAGLADRRDSYVGAFSHGMKQRLALAQALLAEPEVLILDEPMVGLDPMGAKEIRDLIVKLKQDRTVTIFMSSHILPDVEAVCDAVGIINHGRLLAQDSVDNLRRATGGGLTVEVILAQPDARVVKALQEMNCIREVEAEGRRLIIRTTDREEVRPQIIESIIKARGQVLSFGKKEASLEDVLLRVVEEGK